MSTERLISELRMLDIHVSVEGDRLRCNAPPGRLTKELERSLAEHKAELISAIRAASTSPPIRRRSVPGKTLPLSFAQEGFWFAQNLNPDSTVFNLTAYCRLRASVNFEILEKALRALVRRHEILRTRFVEIEGIPAQEVLENADPCLKLFDLGQLNEDERERAAEATIQSFGAHPFDLEVGQLFRTALIRFSEDDWWIVVTAHHIICDGWSFGLFFKELRSLCEDSLTGKTGEAKLPVQYGDFALWERERLSSPTLTAQIQFWKEKLRGAPTCIDLPLDHPRSHSRIYKSRRCSFRLDVATSESLRQLGRDSAATPFMVLLAVFTALLSRYSGEEDIVVATPATTRTTTHLEKLIGCFINTQLLRTSVPPEITPRELIKSVRSTLIDSLGNADVPFEVLVRQILPKRDITLSPPFQHAFILLNTPQAQEYEVKSGGAAIDMTLYMWETGDGFQGSLEYDGALFDPATIACFAGCFQTLAAQMAGKPNTPLEQLALMTPEQEGEWFCSQSGFQAELPVECVQEWVERQVRATPEQIAVISGSEQLTFRQIWTRAGSLAARLRDLGIKPGDLVALCLNRTFDLVAAPLATWLAGAAYVPLDPSYPVGRLALILREADPAALITESDLLERLPGKLPSVICLDQQQREQAPPLPTVPVKGDDLAYLMFTSGSTGVPKGVEVLHRSLVNLLVSMQREPGFGPTDCLLAVTTLSFDISGLELFLPLVSGARLVIAPSAAVTDGTALARLLTEFDVTIMQATPATWRLLLESGWKGKPGLKVLCGGEALPRQLAEQLVATGAELWNLYGPTETTIWSTVQRIQAPVERVPIGHPIANTQTYVLDKRGRPSPPGVTGELFIGGAGLARGYRKQSELTTERFVGSRHYPGARLYRTGDLVRRLPDGSLEFVARMDQQVKLRGFRIELEEIQTALEGQQDVAQAVVTVREDFDGDKKLIAYWKARDGATANSVELRRSLRGFLPEIMIPAECIRLENFPMTPNGKIDRTALSSFGLNSIPNGTGENTPEDGRGGRSGSGRSSDVPTNHVEIKLDAIWREVLQLDRIGIYENFFELGGHSLLATRVISSIRAELDMELPLQSIFADPTIAGLAKHIYFEPSARKYRYTLDPPQWKRLVPVQPRGDRTPLFFLAGYHKPDGPLLFLSHLIPYLGEDQPVFGFQPRWMDGEGDNYTSVEAIAREYLVELRTVQPTGPYFLGGNCVEGIAVLEIARLLEQEGEEVKLVILLDTERPSVRNIIRRDLSYHRSRLEHMGEVVGKILRAKGRERVQAIHELAARKAGIANSSEDRENDRFQQRRANHCRLLYRHSPEPWSGRITLIGNEDELRWNRDFGWTGFSQGGVDVHAVSGSHDSMLVEHGKEVAQIMRRCMDEALGERAEELEAAQVGIR